MFYTVSNNLVSACFFCYLQSGLVIIRFFRNNHLKNIIHPTFTRLCISLPPDYPEEPQIFSSFPWISNISSGIIIIEYFCIIPCYSSIVGSSPFSGVSSLFTGVSCSFTSLFRRASLFPGVSPKLLIILVSTRFFSALLCSLVSFIPVTRSS